MTIESLVRLAAYLISETATQDPKVGGPIQVATITADSGFQLLSRDQVQAAAAENDLANERLRQSFLGANHNGT